ncbi:2-phosphosulfolactate phosphatase [Cellulomonas sp. 179-A 9B4 NHS]|uniref:2-phosphosulfolactate phosphatase n=1 Tax=Cellulomonas sp. 179-A 9B4 NHS TaxID=3142379 RepID=UPI0039A07B25
MDGVFGQGGHDVRLDWGPVGAAACGGDVGVVVDVLSFSTTVTVAVERGTRVHPCPWDDERARALAAEHDAVLAVGRLEAVRDGAVVAPSLSPAGLLALDPVERLVLPSPNGSALAAALTLAGSTVVAGCLRNAHAVATWVAGALDDGRTVTVVAAGERWTGDRSLRPALEDHLGAGAVLSHLVSAGHGDRLSPEAWAAAALFDASAGRLRRVLHDCVGGQELAGRGFAADVDVAADLDASTAVPLLVDGAFVDGART